MVKDKGYLLALDQGTTSTRVMAFDFNGRILACHQIELTQYYPKPGWVEHNPQEIWHTAQKVITEVLKVLPSRKPLALGITNQRETTVLWDKKTGRAVHNAIVWQDRRTADACQVLAERGYEDIINTKTGLFLDPYFSATKLQWLLDRDHSFKVKAKNGDLAFGTIESFLLFKLAGYHATDATNASRTMLYDINNNMWDDDLLSLFSIPKAILPEVVENAFDNIQVKNGLFEAQFPITAMLGDQQAAALGQGCISAGNIKSTYGTGCFVLQNTGKRVVRSKNKLLSTIAYQINGQTNYALEGSIFIAGAVVQWLRDGLGIIETAEETEALVKGLDSNQGVYLVPAFTGLGAPHWAPEARGAILGLTRDTGSKHLVRAALESVAYQTHDLFDAFEADSGAKPSSIRVDGGMIENTWFAQFLADILAIPIERPKVTEITALGAAFLAGIGAGVYDGIEDIKRFWQLDRRFQPTMDQTTRERCLIGWRQALQSVIV